MNRYQVTIQHDVIVYAESEKAARITISRNPEMKLRQKLQVIFIQQIPLPEQEPAREVIDERRAPGS